MRHLSKLRSCNSSLLGNRLTLENVCGDHWQVKAGWMRNYGGFRLEWRKFFLENQLCLGNILVFKLTKHSHFLVTIYNRSGEELQPALVSLTKKRKKNEVSAKAQTNDGNPSPAAAERNDRVVDSEEDDDDVVEVDANYVPVKQTKKSTEVDMAEDSPGLKSNAEQTPNKRMKVSRIYLLDFPGARKAFSAACSFKDKLKNSCFVKLMAVSHINGSTVCAPKGFKVPLLRSGTITLKNSYDQHIEVGWADDRFSSGWKDFRAENQIKIADVCVFELLEPGVFKVHIFRRDDFATSLAAEVDTE